MGNAASPSTQADQYLQRMEGLLGYDTARFQKLTALHAATTRNSQDYELGHWLDGHLENQADRIYDMEQRLQQLRALPRRPLVDYQGWTGHGNSWNTTKSVPSLPAPGRQPEVDQAWSFYRNIRSKSGINNTNYKYSVFLTIFGHKK